jgi:hypothetical protein
MLPPFRALINPQTLPFSSSFLPNTIHADVSKPRPKMLQRLHNRLLHKISRLQRGELRPALRRQEPQGAGETRQQIPRAECCYDAERQLARPVDWMRSGIICDECSLQRGDDSGWNCIVHCIVGVLGCKWGSLCPHGKVEAGLERSGGASDSVITWILYGSKSSPQRAIRFLCCSPISDPSASTFLSSFSHLSPIFVAMSMWTRPATVILTMAR